MASGPFTLAQLARAAGVGIEEVRFYRACGLLQPPRRRRGQGGDTAFHSEHVERLRLIRRARSYGFEVEAIAQLVDPSRSVTCGDIYRLSVAQLDALCRLRGPDDSTVITLKWLIERCGRTGSRRDCQILGILSREDEPHRRSVKLGHDPIADP
jgi:DNA-binding transcriptional MerR regulator